MKHFSSRHFVICNIGMFSLGAIISSSFFYKLVKKHLIGRRSEVNSYKSYYEMMRKWIPLYQKGIRIAKYFEENNYRKIAIYGMGDMGILFYEDVKESELEIAYVIKAHEGERDIGKEIKDIEDDLDAVDAIVVCEIGAYDYVSNLLRDRIDYPLIPLDDIIYELF